MVRIHNGTEIRYYKQRVDVLLGSQSPSGICWLSNYHLVAILSIFRQKSPPPSWFGPNKHYCAEYCSACPGQLFPISDSKSTALLEVVQEICKANPNMDDLKRLLHPTQTIPLGFQ